MKNKETIIDSIDVSECMLYKGYCRIAALCDYSGHLCEVTSNCYFKQLARAKEEIKKLKVQIENEKQALQIDIDNLNQACLDLNQENDDLQNKLQAKEQEIEILKTQNIALQTMEFEEKKKYKKALKRIEHLVTHAFCLTIGTNKDTANLAQQIMRIVAKAKDGE